MGNRRKPRRSRANAELAASGPICKHCGSPWFEPENGVLRCCDCGAQYGNDSDDRRMAELLAELAAHYNGEDGDHG